MLVLWPNLHLCKCLHVYRYNVMVLTSILPDIQLQVPNIIGAISLHLVVVVSLVFSRVSAYNLHFSAIKSHILI